jgi:hypothetical protein
MDATHSPTMATAPQAVTEAEWQARLDLAACYGSARTTAGPDMIHAHITARVPASPDQVLINSALTGRPGPRACGSTHGARVTTSVTTVDA